MIATLLELHTSGVHVRCRPLAWGKKNGDGTHRRCPMAGKVERIHDHDYPGPLLCGCDEFGDDY